MFYRINDCILISKLEAYGIRGALYLTIANNAFLITLVLQSWHELTLEFDREAS